MGVMTGLMVCQLLPPLYVLNNTLPAKNNALNNLISTSWYAQRAKGKRQIKELNNERMIEFVTMRIKIDKWQMSFTIQKINRVFFLLYVVMIDHDAILLFFWDHR